MKMEYIQRHSKENEDNNFYNYLGIALFSLHNLLVLTFSIKARACLQLTNDDRQQTKNKIASRRPHCHYFEDLAANRALF